MFDVNSITVVSGGEIVQRKSTLEFLEYSRKREDSGRCKENHEREMYGRSLAEQVLYILMVTLCGPVSGSYDVIGGYDLVLLSYFLLLILFTLIRSKSPSVVRRLL